MITGSHFLLKRTGKKLQYKLYRLCTQAGFFNRILGDVTRVALLLPSVHVVHAAIESGQRIARRRPSPRARCCCCRTRLRPTGGTAVVVAGVRRGRRCARDTRRPSPAVSGIQPLVVLRSLSSCRVLFCISAVFRTVFRDRARRSSSAGFCPPSVRAVSGR